MIMKQLVIFVSSLYLLSFSTLFAGNNFSGKVFDHVQDYRYEIANSYVTTIQGTFKGIWKKLKDFDDQTKFEQKSYKLNSFAKNFEGVKLYLQSDIIKKKKKKPGFHKKHGSKYKITKHYIPQKSKLLFYLAGLFDPGESGNTKGIISEYIDLGYHVAVISNPLSIDFMGAVPTYEIGNVKSEAKAVFKVIEKVIKEMEGRNLLIDDEVHLSGISHGAFISSIIAAMDSNSKRPMITGNVTIFSPPYDLLKSARYLDLASAESKEDSDIGIIKLIKKVWSLLRIDAGDDIKEEQAGYAKAIVSNVVFKKSLIETLEKYDEATGKLQIPRMEDAYEQWVDDMNFMRFYREYVPKAYKELKNGDAKIAKWFEIYHQNTGNNIRVVTSQDDFLNDPMDWNSLDPGQAIVLGHGGHMGFMAQKKWFKKFVELSF